MTTKASPFFKDTLIKAFYYIASADGTIDEKEMKLAHAMVDKEGIEVSALKAALEEYEQNNDKRTQKALVDDLKKLNKKDQTKIIAYMSNIANCNGFMDPAEWKLIYNLYKNELNLELEDIIEVQKFLPPYKK